MPRPSLKDQRSEEILDAYLTCVARFGLEGATQERIAAEAGVKRPLLRHYLGNRDQMIAALNEHVVETFNGLTGRLASALAEAQNAEDMVGILFSEDAESDPRLLLAWQGLSVSAAENPEMRADLLDSLDRFLKVLSDTLNRIVPKADPARVRAVAQGISSSFVTLDSLSPLSPPAEWHQDLKQAALLLARTLEGPA
ncbi:TetR/AcrR family transcriptional regulator [Rhodobacteraceae bacterium M382]|nr:TetR/AcrR family transcriptional regulator [Rhodobacteraceae bacterium M382]